MRIILLAATAGIALAWGGPALMAKLAPADELYGVAHVIDGDTIALNNRRVRLAGIDAPELSQECIEPDNTVVKCGQGAKRSLQYAIGNYNVTCIRKDVDHYGRIVADCYANGISLNELMVRIGMAVAYYRPSPAILSAERTARAEQRGIWNTRFERPSQYRKTH